jgi:hypothetical protein
MVPVPRCSRIVVGEAEDGPVARIHAGRNIGAPMVPGESDDDVVQAVRLEHLSADRLVIEVVTHPRSDRKAGRCEECGQRASNHAEAGDRLSDVVEECGAYQVASIGTPFEHDAGDGDAVGDILALLTPEEVGGIGRREVRSSECLALGIREARA